MALVYFVIHKGTGLAMTDFYCKVKCGDPDFSIDEWNKAFIECCNMGVSEKEMSYILDGEPCEEQCFDCLATVGDTQKS